MAKKKKISKKKKVAKKKTAKKKVSKKKPVKKAKATRKKAIKKKSSKKKATKKKATKKKVSSKKTAKKKVPAKKKPTKKTAVKKTSAKKETKRKVAKKTTKKAVKKVNDNTKPVLKVYAPKVAVGAKVPEFSLPATGDQNVTVEGLSGKKAVIFFYPKDATPGCTIEGHDFTRLKEDFTSSNTVVYGVSRDSMKSHERFKEKQSYSIDLISDENEELCSIFGAIRLKNMYGKQVRGIDRSTFVIDESGKLIKEWRKVKVDGHADEVLSFVKSVES